MKTNLVLLGLLFAFSPVFFCASVTDMFPDKEEIPEPDQVMMRIIDQTTNELEKKYHIHSCGIGMSGKFKYVCIEFQIFKELTKDESRAMLLDCIEIFLEKINANEKIRKYLVTYPFTKKNVGICFYIRNRNKEETFHPEICVTEWSARGVTFYTRDPEKKYGYKEILEETHEEAIELVKKYRAGLVTQATN